MTFRIRSNQTIYNVVENALTELGTPQTCTQLMERDDVRKAAMDRFGGDLQTATNKLSDMLGFMHRKGVIHRYVAPGDTRSMARYACGVKTKGEDAEVHFLPSPVRLIGSQKSSIEVQQTDEGVRIEFDHFILTIKPK